MVGADATETKIKGMTLTDYKMLRFSCPVALVENRNTYADWA
jgi:hypothetical protein